MNAAYALDPQGRTMPGTMAYWFAWSAFHPSTKIYRIRKSGRPAGKEKSR